MDDAEDHDLMTLTQRLVEAQSELIVAEMALKMAGLEFERALDIEKALSESNARLAALGAPVPEPEPPPKPVDKAFFVAVQEAKARVKSLSQQLERSH